MEVKEGNYYFSNWESGKFEYVFKAGKPEKYDSCGIDKDSKNYYATGCSFTVESTKRRLKNLRIATPQEEAHLQACIIAGKYVEPTKEPDLQLIEIY